MLSACPRSRKPYIIPMLFQCSWQPESIKSHVPHQKGIFGVRMLTLQINVHFGRKVYSGCKNALLDENMTFGWQCDFLWIHGARNIKKPLVLCSVSGHCPTKYGLSFKGCFLREKCDLCTKCDIWSENCILSYNVGFLWK